MKDDRGSIRTGIQERSGGAVAAAGERVGRLGRARGADRPRHWRHWREDAWSRPARAPALTAAGRPEAVATRRPRTMSKKGRGAARTAR
jgi:hypothetical protein